MWSFLSTVFFLWCLYSIFRWLFPGKAAREQKRAERAARLDAERQEQKMKTYKEKERKEREALGLGDWKPGVRRQRIPFDKILKWEGGPVFRLVYSPIVESLNMKVEFALDLRGGARVTKGSLLDVWVSHWDYGHPDVMAPAAGVWVPVAEHGSILSPGDVILELDTTPEVLLHWEEAEAAERAERVRKAQEREKAEIAAKLKARQSRRQLEEQVRMELIDSGELFGDQPKRPPIPREVVDAVYRRDGARCVYCGSTENLQLDHVIPFSKGGATSLENLQLLCQKCNLEKSNKIG